MKKIKILTIILVIILITMISFFGVYTKVQNRMENRVKDYSLAMDLKGTRVIRLSVDSTTNTVIKDAEGNTIEESLTDEEIEQKGYKKEETKANPDEALNTENYKKAKEIIEKRLKELKKIDNFQMQDYEIKLDEENGDIIVELAENDRTDSIISNLYTTGKFEIVDTETQEVLINNSDIKTARTMYGTNSSYQTTVYMEIELTKEGAKKLEQISNEYKKIEETTEDSTDTEENEENTENSTDTEENESETQASEDENTTNTEETNNTTDVSETENNEDSADTEETTEEEKTVTMRIDDEEIMTSSFDEPIDTGKLQLSVGSASSDSETLQDYINQASTMSTVLKAGNIPLKYTVEENEYIMSDIDNKLAQEIFIAIAVIIALALVILIIRYKINGLLGTISYIGLISIFLLLIRYANIIVSIEGILGALIILILNYIFTNKLLSKIKELTIKDVKNAIKETYKEFFIKMMPIFITVIVFCFIKWIPISSFGTVMLWGIILIAIYNFIITSTLLKIRAKE